MTAVSFGCIARSVRMVFKRPVSEAGVYIESTHTSCRWCAQRMLLDTYYVCRPVPRQVTLVDAPAGPAR